MANQIVVSAGAKVRNLQDVIIGTNGVLTSLGFDVANGVPKLDVNGKILVSQLPNSVMEYKGTWNISTNTPTLVNGTGNQGDVYLVEGAAVGGTSFNFGAGSILFFNGDQAIYSGSIWQRASGATGTVTSVALTESGDSLNITGSPITTSGTINIGFNGTNLQYVNGAGNLTTFPTLITSIGLSMPSAFSVANSPLTANGTIAVTGAGTTAQYIRGDGSLATFPTIATEAQRLITEVYNETGATLSKGTVVYINGGHGNLPTITKALATGDATSAQTYGIVQTDITNMNNGYVVVIGSLTDLDTSAYVEGTQLYLSSTTAGAWTSVKQYAPAHLVYVAIVTRSHPTQGVVEVMIQNGFEMDELHNVSAQSPLNNQGLFYNTSTSLWENKSIATALGYTPISLTSLSASSPLSYNNTTGAFSIQVANTSQNGYLSSTDWNTFNSKENNLTFYSPLVKSGSSVTIPPATSIANGYLTSTDWSTFNSKQAALSGTGFVKISGTTISYDNSTYYLASNPSAFIALTALSAGTGISYNNTTGVITNSSPDQTVSLTAGAGISVSGTYPSFTIASTITQYTDALARASLSFAAGSGAYNSTTGVITIPTNNNQITNGAGYITGNQTITLSGDVSGSGTTAITTTIGALKVTNAMLAGSIDLTTKVTGLLPDGNISSAATWNAKQNAITLTTTGTSGAATLVGATLNIPQYTDTYTGTVTSVAALTIGTSGTDLSSSVANSTTTPVITLNVPTASATNRGALSSADWTTFNNKQSTITLTTTGTSGVATFSANTLNIPNYGSALSGYLPLSGGTLTGALTGTSATFSAEVTSSGSQGRFGGWATGAGYQGAALEVGVSGGVATLIGYNRTSGAYIPVIIGGGTNQTTTIGGNIILLQNNGVTNLTLAASGAATFSSSVTAAGLSRIGDVYVGGRSGTYAAYTDAIVGDNLHLAASGTSGAVYINTALSRNLIINPVGGNVGIGETNPNCKFDVVGASNASNTYGIATFRNSSNGGISIGASGTSYTWIQGNVFGSGYATLALNASGGNVLIGTTTDAGYKLDVNGTGRFSGNVSAATNININAANNSTSPYLLLNQTGGNTYGIIGINRSDGTGIATGLANALVLRSGDGTDYPIQFATNNNIRLTIASTGAATFSSSVTATSGIINGTTDAFFDINRSASGNAGRVRFQTAGTDEFEIGLKGGVAGFHITKGDATELVTVLTSGNVGIGTTSPGAKLVVSNGGALGYEIDPASTSGTVVSLFSYDRSAAAWKTTRYSSLDHRFEVNGTSEAMRITSGGNVLIGSTDDGSGSKVLSYSTSAATQFKAAGTAPAITFTNTITGASYGGVLGACTSANHFISGTSAGDMVLANQFSGYRLYAVSYSGGVYLTSGATSWTANSDIRLKNINSYIENAVEKLSTLQTINFSYKDDKTNKQNIGLIAQEVEKIFPELIDKNGDGMLGVRYTELVPVLIKAVQELKAEINNLKNK